MNKADLFRADLTIHLIGMATLAGAALSSFVLFRPFVKSGLPDLEESLMMLQLQKKLSRLMATGLGIQVVSGILLIVTTGGGYGAQLWFKVKMLTVLVVFMGSVFLSRGLQARLYTQLLSDRASGQVKVLKRLARNIGVVQLFLLCLILTIFILSVFRFQ